MNDPTQFKNEPLDDQPRISALGTSREKTAGLELHLWNTSLSCEKLCKSIRDLSDEHETLKQEQHDRVAALQVDLERLRQENSSLQSEVNRQRNDYNLLVSGIGRVYDEKQQVVDQRNAEQFQKELNGFMLDQYRDASVELNKKIDEKDAEIRRLAGAVTRLETDVKNQYCYYERYITGVQRERDDIFQAFCHERDTARERRPAASKRSRRRGCRKNRSRGGIRGRGDGSRPKAGESMQS